MEHEHNTSSGDAAIDAVRRMTGRAFPGYHLHLDIEASDCRTGTRTVRFVVYLPPEYRGDEVDPSLTDRIPTSLHVPEFHVVRAQASTFTAAAAVTLPAVRRVVAAHRLATIHDRQEAAA